MIRYTALGISIVFIGLLWAPCARAEEAGQEDLDKATQMQLRIESLEDIEEVVKLCESALRKGLDDANKEFAKQLLVSSLWHHASQLSQAIFDTPRPHPRWQFIRRLILNDLDKLLGHNKEFTDAYLLTARLQGLPGGDRDKGVQAVNTAIELLSDDKAKQSEALVLRARLRSETEQQLADLSEAIKVDPANSDAWQTRAAVYIGQGDLEKAVSDFEELLKNDAENVLARQALAEALANLEKYDLALEHVAKAIELEPESSLNFTLRARIHEEQGEVDKALADLDQAIKVNPTDVVALMSRATMHLRKDNLKEARADVDRVLQINATLTRAILLRSVISAAEGRVLDAIADVQTLLRHDPNNVELRLQLASYYVADQRPRKGISILNTILEKDKENWQALRARGDARLSIGQHAEAVQDYNAALKQAADNDGVLNNLAWVLATSPKDEVRDGQRAIELATKACEVTNYEMPHILSTLAAGYAETGDFEKAIHWSTKAVELGREKLKDQLEQLEAELKSYQDGKPFRELQNVEEKGDPPRRVIET